MISVQRIEEVRQAVAKARSEGKVIGLVPTMGALHAGHASLIDAARSLKAPCVSTGSSDPRLTAGASPDAAFVVVSIFVNPTQFGPNEDLAKYPRTPQKDLDLCREHGADLVFVPNAEEMYGLGHATGTLTEITVKSLSDGLCGRSRPGHFAGVCTVVAKLFNIVQPDRAYFGAKDYQQATIIRRMTADLNYPIEIVVCPTVREPDGLAMSSRNAYLSAEHRRQAPALRQALELGRELILRKHPPAAQVAAAMREHLARAAPAGEVDYLEIVDPNRLCGVKTTDTPLVIALAVRLGGTRLIDNIAVDVREAAS